MYTFLKFFVCYNFECVGVCEYTHSMLCMWIKLEVRRQLQGVGPHVLLWDLGIDSGQQACKASILPAELSHWPCIFFEDYQLNLCE